MSTYATITLKCNINMCQEKCTNKSAIISHLKKHITQSQKITCPFDKCQHSFQNKSSFSSHISRKHSYGKHCTLKSTYIENTFSPESIENTISTEIVNMDEEFETEANSEHLNLSLKQMKNSVALFCLKLMSKHHISAVVVDMIIDEIDSLHEIN